LWGAPLRQREDDCRLRDEFIGASTRLGEAPSARTEPDVIVAWSDLIVLIEVKHRSGNPIQKDYGHFDAYLDVPSIWTVGKEQVKAEGLYELTRNWRLAHEMADGRSLVVINLGPRSTSESAGCFRQLVSVDPARRFQHLLWSEFLGEIREQPAWLEGFITDRKVR
jgi:hypothetical protein